MRSRRCKWVLGMAVAAFPLPSLTCTDRTHLKKQTSIVALLLKSAMRASNRPNTKKNNNISFEVSGRCPRHNEYSPLAISPSPPFFPTPPSPHLVKPNSNNREPREEEKRAASRQASFQQRKREGHKPARQAVHAHRQAHTLTAVSQRENLFLEEQ